MAGYNRISRDDRAGVLSRGQPGRIDVMAAFTLAHLSDPHLAPLPAARFRDLAGKRALGYLNWKRNRHKFHRRDVLDALVSDIRAQLEAWERILPRLSAEQAFRVLLIHHPLRSKSRAKRLTDSDQLLALLKRHGVELILHGHDHVHSTMWFEGPGGPP